MANSKRAYPLVMSLHAAIRNIGVQGSNHAAMMVDFPLWIKVKVCFVFSSAGCTKGSLDEAMIFLLDYGTVTGEKSLPLSLQVEDYQLHPE